ncbi:lysoplasmalogenase [Streptosporangiaceae bacterium NEAU-GS5]|nr:lysoplasmalogenase [Streptosporangiaceae bacterium NEAU-GS5]
MKTTVNSIRGAFWAVAALHLIAIAADLGPLQFGTKVLLMPLLAVWVWARRGPRWVIAALLASAAGDVALEFDGLFIAGMGCFALAHVCYVTFFARSTRPRWGVTLIYGVIWAVLIVLLWSRLGDLQVPVAAYSLLLTGTAATSSWYGTRTGFGGALFLLSDTLIALRLADVQVWGDALLVMITYIAAQYLLASGAVIRVTNRV